MYWCDILGSWVKRVEDCPGGVDGGDMQGSLLASVRRNHVDQHIGDIVWRKKRVKILFFGKLNGVPDQGVKLGKNNWIMVRFDPPGDGEWTRLWLSRKKGRLKVYTGQATKLIIELWGYDDEELKQPVSKWDSPPIDIKPV
jgi:hypothetical protein